MNKIFLIKERFHIVSIFDIHKLLYRYFIPTLEVKMAIYIERKKIQRQKQRFYV